MKQYIEITSCVEGFRRGGIAHSRKPKVYEVSQFTKEQLQQIEKEKKLVCRFFEEKEAEETQETQSEQTSKSNASSKAKSAKAKKAEEAVKD